MIKILEIKDPTKAATPWWKKVKQFEGITSISFVPGLNIIIGPNGSGKSTILRCLARQFHCEQLGHQKITQSSVRELTDFGEDIWRDGILAKHDGRPVFYFDPSVTPGVMYGSFDDDADTSDFSLGLCARSLSSGQHTMMLLQRMQKLTVEHKKIDGMQAEKVNELWAKRILAMRKFLKGTLRKKGNATVLFDEPTRSLDIANQIIFWSKVMPNLTRQAQLIVASHSPLALFAEGAHFIETVPGCADTYRSEVEKLFRYQHG